MTQQARRRGDGDGWVLDCPCGQRHWGHFGAAGLLLRDDAGPVDRYLLQHRATWSHHGGTWGVPGGARNSGESAVAAALREAGEEAGVRADALDVVGEHRLDHGAWAYTTVLAVSTAPLEARALDAESLEVRWVAAPEVTRLPLHPGFATAWPALRAAYPRP